MTTRIQFTAALVMLGLCAATAVARQPPVHTINVTVSGGSPCSLTASPDRVSASPGDTIALVVVGNVPASCGVPSGSRPSMQAFKQNGKAVTAPVNGSNGRYTVTGRRGLYKYSIVLGSIELDPELEIN